MHHVYLTVSLLVIGCAEVPEQPDVVALGGVNCEDFQCGDANSPKIDDKGLHEIHMVAPYQPEPRSQFKITRFFKKDPVTAVETDYLPRVIGAQLVGLNALQQTVLSGQQVEKAELWLKNPSGTEYALRIDGSGSNVNYWAKPGGVQKQTWWYRIIWTTVKDGKPDENSWENICSGKAPEYGEDTLWLPVDATVLFEGDRINSVTKRMYAIDKGWTNIGCAGSALAKMHVTGHSEGAAVQSNLLYTTPAQRNGFLKMIVGDVCDTGFAGTVPGQPLQYKASNGLPYFSQSPATELTIEARWTSRGASCLTKPRIAANPSPAGDAEFEDIHKAIFKACNGRVPGPCTGAVTNLDSHHLISANPLPTQ